MAETAQRSQPIKCPSCSTLTTNNVRSHCGDHWCGWIICDSCEAVINTRNGEFTEKPNGKQK